MLELQEVYESKCVTPLPISVIAKERPFGEQLSSDAGTLPSEGIMSIIERQISFHKDYHTRRWEWMCSGQNTFHGIINYDPGAPVKPFHVDFTDSNGTVWTGGSNDITLVGADLWSAATGVPNNNINTWRKLIYTKSGFTPTHMIMGSDASDAFFNNTQMKELFNLWNFKPGIVDQTNAVLNAGMQYEGRLKGMDIYTSYGEYADDTTGTLTPYMPANHVSIIAQGAPFDIHPCVIYDAQDDGKGGIITIESKEDVYVYIEILKQDAATNVNLVSRSKRVPWPKHIYSWVTAEVI